VAEALQHVDPWALDYDQWISVLAALKHDYGDDALDLAVHWGQGKPGEVEQKWATFGDHPRPSTVRTIYRYARAAGWHPPRDPDPAPETALAAPPTRVRRLLSTLLARTRSALRLTAPSVSSTCSVKSAHLPRSSPLSRSARH